MSSSENACCDQISGMIINAVTNSEHKYTPLDLERLIRSKCGQPAKAVRSVLKSLMAENQLAYTQLMGRTFVEISYRRALYITGGIVLAPPDAAVEINQEKTVVRILAGAAFGMGDHPTTRICLELMAWVFKNKLLPDNAACCRVMDIGTGSGVLAAAACLLGADIAAGTDIDACARVEAAQNAALNGLEHRIKIYESVTETRKAAPGLFPFHLVLANLRYPTLAEMSDLISEISLRHAAIIFSGFRPHEQAGLLGAFCPEKFEILRAIEKNGWCGFAMKKKA